MACLNIIGKDVTKIILYMTDPYTFIQCLKASKKFHGFEELENQQKLKLVKEKYQKKKSWVPIDLFHSITDECFQVFTSRINKGYVNLYDFVYLKKLLKRTSNLLLRIEWDRDNLQREISIIKSYVQDVRVSLFLRSLKEFEVPSWEECPDEIRNKNYDLWSNLSESTKYKTYFNSVEIQGRIKDLNNKYKTLDKYPTLNFTNLFHERKFIPIFYDLVV